MKPGSSTHKINRNVVQNVNFCKTQFFFETTAVALLLIIVTDNTSSNNWLINSGFANGRLAKAGPLHATF
jgi:hypothetical protein